MSVRRWCFVIMPFDTSLDSVFKVVRNTIESLGHGCRRADLNKKAGNLLDLLVSDIEHADLIIADTTGHNPSVFYEIGVAHRIHDTQRVILLHPTGTEMPPDLAGMKWLEYDPNNLSHLRAELEEWVRIALDDSFPGAQGMHPSKELRTQEIVRACELIAQDWNNPAGAERVIRSMAGIASVAISDHEPPDEPGRPSTYQRLLLEERNGLLKLLN